MPHKHTRPSSTSTTTHDLPPTSLARSLPVSKTLSTPKNPNRKPTPQDDTPRAFARLMAYASTGQKTPRGLDDGGHHTPAHRNKKRKRTGADDATGGVKAEVPKILPGERMGDFGARVDQALPVVGLGGKGGGRQTRAEQRMQRMQREWREEEARRKVRVEEAREEEAEEDGEEFGEGYLGLSGVGKGKGKKKRGKRRTNGKGGSGGDGGRVDDDDDDDGDPWAVVAANRKRELAEKEIGGGGLVGLHDVVLAPPKFEKVPKKQIGIEDLVKKGGWKRQVEISEARREVVEGYRRMMRERRGQQA